MHACVYSLIYYRTRILRIARIIIYKVTQISQISRIIIFRPRITRITRILVASLKMEAKIIDKIPEELPCQYVSASSPYQMRVISFSL
jgi:hypothetical protein